MTDVNAQRQTLQQLFNTAIHIRQHEITNMVYESSRGVVQGGPFRGMRLVRQSSWGAGEICPKLLGCYEAELVPQVAEAIAKSFPLVINVGCAEGYYAIGLARRMPKSKVIAYDVSDKAQAVCRANAEVNGVSDRVNIRAACSVHTLSEDLAVDQPAFLLMDCEGAEINLLKPENAPGLENCDILVECHDLFNPKITPSLLERFASTHSVERIEEGARNPNFPMLRKLDSVNRWIAVCEFRMQPQHWLMFRSKKFN